MRTLTNVYRFEDAEVAINEYELKGWAVRQVLYIPPSWILVVLEQTDDRL